MSPPCSPQRVTRGPRTPAERGGGWFLAARRAPAPQAFDSGRGAVVIPAPPASRRCRRGGRQADRPGRAARPGCRRWWCRRRANRWVGLGEDERRAVRGAGHAVGEGEPAGGLADRAVRANVSEDTGSELARREAEAGVSDVGHDPSVDHHVAPRMAGLPAQVRISGKGLAGSGYGQLPVTRRHDRQPAVGQEAGQPGPASAAARRFARQTQPAGDRRRRPGDLHLARYDAGVNLIADAAEIADRPAGQAIQARARAQAQEASWPGLPAVLGKASS